MKNRVFVMRLSRMHEAGVEFQQLRWVVLLGASMHAQIKPCAQIIRQNFAHIIGTLVRLSVTMFGWQKAWVETTK